MSQEFAYKPSAWGQEFHSLTTDEALGAGSAGPGKAVSIWTRVPTPSGITTMEEIRVGDRVLSENGDPCEVIFATGVMHGRDCYEVEFEDCSVVIADGDHLWSTLASGDESEIVRTTIEVLADMNEAGRFHSVRCLALGSHGELARIYGLPVPSRKLIRRIIKTDSVPVKCIQVNSPSKLYLITDQYIATHNTTVLIHEPLPYINIEHLRTLRLSQDELQVRRGFSEEWAKLIAENPLRTGESIGWCLFLRRELTQVEQVEAKMIRHFKIIDPGFEWRSQRKIGVFTSGLTVKLGHCANTGDWDQYLSDEFFLICYDELVTFEEEQYTQINTRNRSSDPILGRMLKIRAMSNPFYKREGNTANVKDPHWVRRRFVDPYRQGRKILFEDFKDPHTGEKITKTRIYLPAKLTDNPSKEFQQIYMRTLIDKPQHIKSALIEGDWYIVADSFFGDSFTPRIHVRKPFKIPADWKRFRMMDWGHKTFGCILWGAMDYDEDLYIFREFSFRLLNAREVALRAKEIEKSLGCWDGKRSLLTGPADTQLWEERGDTGLTKAEEFAKVGLTWVPANKKSRLANAAHVLKRLNSHEDGTRNPGLMFFDDCEKIISTLPLIQPDPNNPEEPQKGGDDHWYDALSYGCNYASRGSSSIAMHRPSSHRDDEDEESERFQESRGRYGYGEGY